MFLVRHSQTEWNRIKDFWLIRQDTCAINLIESYENDFVLISLNDTCGG
jgi:hypothetical protein